jgi:mono/diheme cytochrome c family protein
MRWIACLNVATCIAGSALAGEALAQNTGNAEIGLALAQRLCSECHAVQPQQPRSPNAFAPHFEYIANVPGMTSLALGSALQSSHKTMPNIVLDPSETTHIIRYIMSLQREK